MRDKGVICVLGLLLFVVSCTDHPQAEIIFPLEKINYLPHQEVIAVDTSNFSSIKDITICVLLENNLIVGTENGLHVLDDSGTIKIKSFNFVSGYNVGFDIYDMVLNSTREKMLVSASTGIIFQLDLTSFEVDWLVKFQHLVKTMKYSNDGKTIAVGTSGNHKEKKDSVITRYYSSLLLLDSDSGNFVKCFNESADIKRIEFSGNDSLLLAASDWNYTDTYLWDIATVETSKAQFLEDNAYVYDTGFINDSTAVTLSGNALTYWEINKPFDIASKIEMKNTGAERLFLDLVDDLNLVVSYPRGTANHTNILYLDNGIKDTVHLERRFVNVTLSSNDSLLIGMSDNEDVVFYNIHKRKITKVINLASDI